MESAPRHPKGTSANILLTSVFGPYARDDTYGSRRINPMELYHNQVTREDGAFSLRMFHRSGNLALLQANIDAPCTLLDFPTLDQFVEEIASCRYDVVGITAIVVNIFKVSKMCELIRKHLPKAAIVLGGHIANIPDIEKRLDVDHVVKGDGVNWFRRYLGQDECMPVRHPLIDAGFRPRTTGMRIPEFPGLSAAWIFPSAGCPVGCNFCSTSNLFGGKGNFINFYKTGDELFSVMNQVADKMKVHDLFIQDENFLLHREKVLRLLELMEKHGKNWSLYIFASAKALQMYTIDQLLSLGVTHIWLGLEGQNSGYNKLEGVDTRNLVRHLQDHGIRIFGSTIIGLDDHKPENMDEVIDWAVSHNADFHQFMLFMALPGTPLYAERERSGALLSEQDLPLPDRHGQYRFNYHHPHIKAGDESEYLYKAFCMDRDVNGPSIVRQLRTQLNGYQRYKDHPDPRIRKRIRWEAARLKDVYAALLWVSVKYYNKRGNQTLGRKFRTLLHDFEREFGWKSKLMARVIGSIGYFTIGWEEKRLANGMEWEPPKFREQNEPAYALEHKNLWTRWRAKKNLKEWVIP